MSVEGRNSAMTKEEYEKLRDIWQIKNVLTINDLTNKHPRTLLYGYHTDSTTVHVYICPKWGEIKTVTYGGYGSDKPVEATILEDEEFIPSKRLYPGKCDFEFVKLLKERGVNMAFTTWQESEDGQFYGKIL